MIALMKWWQSLGDRRRHLRHPSQQVGFINLEGASEQRSCLIADISASGAKLVVANSRLPEEFTLLVPHRCRIVRRMDGKVGVQFVDDLSAMTSA